MTWMKASLAALFAAFAFSHIPAAAQETLFPQTLTVPLDPTDSAALEVGELSYRGGVEIEPGDNDIGGLSGLEWADGSLHAVSDDGRWLRLEIDEIRDRLVDVVEIQMGGLHGLDGKRLKRKRDGDAEAIARAPDGTWLISFEQDHRILRYTDLNATAQIADISAVKLAANAEANSGLEALAITQDGWLVCGEWTAEARPNCMRTAGAEMEVAAFSLAAPPPLDQRGGVPTGADCASTGVCFVLFRSYSRDLGNGTAIVAVAPDGSTETLGSWTGELTIDNFEGIAVREENNRTYLYIVSDNNFSGDQRTLLMKFEVNQRAAETPGEPEKVYATERVVLETSLGEIVIALETERAPITAANFLRYVEEGRYDGTRFYRASRQPGAAQPAGFLQGGTQNDPKRILDPIAHESTIDTGLSHTDGALSMARFDPGTATGDFSIMIGNQTGLDANPQAEDPANRPGFAVFGYVVEGMEVVHAIHATPTDPNKGEGFLKGQMLAEPVEIISARRASAAD